MQKSVALVVLLLIAGAVAFFLFWGGDAVPVAPRSNDATNVVVAPEAAHDRVDTVNRGEAVPGQPTRTEVATAPAGVFDDPEIQAGLSGFRGRVVTHDERPVADCGVRFYRGGMDTVLSEGIDLFADAPTAVPKYVAGETQTAADGTFLVTGVWPFGFYILFAGIGTEAPMHQVITRTPSPGEIIDLGDVVLPDAGVIVGTVVDGEGEPLAGALVRAADVPGTLASFFPLERFDPEGALLIREPMAPVTVVEMPSWVREAFDHVPVPTTRTAGDGTFRLVGVVPGSNMLAVTAADYLADVKPSVIVRAGQEKDVGTIRMREGEELVGKVLDTAGKPVVGAEVFAGSTISMAPVDLARRLDVTDAKGQFSGLGFASGQVTVAARRGPGHSWVRADPQPILGDVVVTLPATFGADVTVRAADAEPPKSPRFRLLQGTAGDGAAEMAVFGFVPPVDLGDRLEGTDDPGRWRIGNLPPGKYTLLAEAPGYATAFAGFRIDGGDAAVTLELKRMVEFAVRVLGPEDKPIRNASIYAETHGERLFGMPLHCGRTGADGTLRIDRFQADELRISAEHPKYGVVNGLVRISEELVLRMQPPGAIEGKLTFNGAPAEPGKYTVIVEWRRGEGPRGPFEQVPRMVTPDADGSFRIAALQPGQYRLQSIESLDALRSPGGVVQAMMSMRMFAGNQTRETVEVVSGQTAQVQLEAGEKPIEGPTAHLYGSVLVNGRVVEGYNVRGWGEGRRFAAATDRAGRFDLGTVPVGHVWVQVSSNEGLMAMGSDVWSSNLELKEAEERELTIDIMTSSIAGVVLDPAGSPAGGVHLWANGKLKGSDGNASLHTAVDASGSFKFDTVPEGTWQLEVRGGQDAGYRGRLRDVQVQGGVPVTDLRIQLVAAVVVKGTVDMTVFGNDKVEWCWISVHKPGADGRSVGEHLAGIHVDTDDGKFTTSELEPGTYALRLNCNMAGGMKTWRCQDLVVPPQGLEDVVLRGVPE